MFGMDKTKYMITYIADSDLTIRKDLYLIINIECSLYICNKLDIIFIFNEKVEHQNT